MTHYDDGKRFIVRADEKLTAFVDLESAIRKFFPNFAPEFLEKNEKKKQMRAFNSSYVRYVRSLIQSLEKERTSALRRAPLSVLPSPRFS